MKRVSALTHTHTHTHIGSLFYLTNIVCPFTVADKKRQNLAALAVGLWQGNAVGLTSKGLEILIECSLTRICLEGLRKTRGIRRDSPYPSRNFNVPSTEDGEILTDGPTTNSETLCLDFFLLSSVIIYTYIYRYRVIEKDGGDLKPL